MTTRTTQTVARFTSPFLLPGFDAPQPAGEYRVDEDEQLIETSTHIAWRRVGAFVFLPALGSRNPTQQMVPVTPADLDAALQKDKETE